MRKREMGRKVKGDAMNGSSSSSSLLTLMKFISFHCLFSNLSHSIAWRRRRD